MKDSSMFLVYLAANAVGISILGISMYAEENPITGMAYQSAITGTVENWALISVLLGLMVVVFLIALLMRKK